MMQGKAVIESRFLIEQHDERIQHHIKTFITVDMHVDLKALVPERFHRRRKIIRWGQPLSFVAIDVPRWIHAHVLSEKCAISQQFDLGRNAYFGRRQGLVFFERLDHRFQTLLRRRINNSRNQDGAEGGIFRVEGCLLYGDLPFESEIGPNAHVRNGCDPAPPDDVLHAL